MAEWPAQSLQGLMSAPRSRSPACSHARARRAAAALVVLACAGADAGAQAREPATPFLEELTWTELRDRLAAGTTIALVPIGGTEQSGPYLALGKHNARVRVLAGRIAQRLGDALVAPVLAYVPEGSIDPPSGHMRFPGTISIPEPAFESVLDGAARSLCHGGFRTVVFLGDHGDYQKNEERVAARFGRERSGCKVIALVDYYRAAQAEHAEALRSRGLALDEIGTHAGLADTSLSMALAPADVRSQALAHAPRPGVADGVHGDPRRASAELGQLGVDRIVERSVRRIRELTR